MLNEWNVADFLQHMQCYCCGSLRKDDTVILINTDTVLKSYSLGQCRLWSKIRTWKSKNPDRANSCFLRLSVTMSRLLSTHDYFSHSVCVMNEYICMHRFSSIYFSSSPFKKQAEVLLKNSHRLTGLSQSRFPCTLCFSDLTGSDDILGPWVHHLDFVEFLHSY